MPLILLPAGSSGDTLDQTLSSMSGSLPDHEESSSGSSGFIESRKTPSVHTGSGETADTDDALPDLVLAYGTGGELGYIKSADIPALPTTEEEIRALPHVTGADGVPVATQESLTIPLYADDGTTVLGDFRIGN